MISKKRSDFYFTLENDERKCLASIERAEQKIRVRNVTRDSDGADPRKGLGRA